MPRQGFLGTGAPLSADITLAIEIAMGLALVLGMVLARRQRYRAHAWCQSTVVALKSDRDWTGDAARVPQPGCSEDSCAFCPSLLRSGYCPRNDGMYR